MDVHEQAMKVAAELDALEFSERAEALRNAMAAGSTGGEIHMALRYHLRETLEQAGLPGELRQALQSLLSEIGEALGDH